MLWPDRRAGSSGYPKSVLDHPAGDVEGLLYAVYRRGLFVMLGYHLLKRILSRQGCRNTARLGER
jgi:hypothetical protein